MEIFNRLIGLSPPVLIGVFVFTMLNFIIPDRFIDKINFAQLDHKTAKRMWLAMIASVSLLFGMLVVDIYNTGLKPFYNDYMKNLKLESRLKLLTDDEIVFLKRFIEKKTLSQFVNIRDKTGAVDALERDDVIYLIKENKEARFWHYNIERWAYYHLLEHSELLTKSATQQGAT